MTSIRTPLKKVRGLGSAGAGAEHFWLQRITALANLFLVILAIALVLHLSGSNYETVKATFANPLVSILMLALILSGVIHMWLGMQSVIEDYVHGDGARIVALVLNRFFAIFIGLTSIFAVLKLGFGV